MIMNSNFKAKVNQRSVQNEAEYERFIRHILRKKIFHERHTPLKERTSGYKTENTKKAPFYIFHVDFLAAHCETLKKYIGKRLYTLTAQIYFHYIT